MLSETQAELEAQPSSQIFKYILHILKSPLKKFNTSVRSPNENSGFIEIHIILYIFLQKVICCPSSYTNKQTSFSLINCTPSKMNYYEITILAAKKVVIKNVLQKDPATSNRSNLRFHRKFQLTPPLQQALKFHNNFFLLAVPGIMKNGSLLLLLCMQQKKVQPIYILDKCVVQFSPFCQKKGQ